MQEFRSIKYAARVAINNDRPAYVFDGPEGTYYVASGKTARGLMNNGLVPLSLSETAKAAA